MLPGPRAHALLHWYERREAYHDGTLSELPDGWRRVVDRYRLGLSGDWGQ